MSKTIYSKRFSHQVFKPINSGVDVSAWVRELNLDPVRVAEIMADLRRPNGVSRSTYGLACRAATKEPLLNADKNCIERSLSKNFNEHGSRHAKLKMFRKVELKPNSATAAKIAGTWAQHTWEVWTLKYSPGIILRNHHGDETDVFPGWGSMKKTLESIGFKIIR